MLMHWKSNFPDYSGLEIKMYPLVKFELKSSVLRNPSGMADTLALSILDLGWLLKEHTKSI